MDGYRRVALCNYKCQFKIQIVFVPSGGGGAYSIHNGLYDRHFLGLLCNFLLLISLKLILSARQVVELWGLNKVDFLFHYKIILFLFCDNWGDGSWFLRLGCSFCFQFCSFTRLFLSPVCLLCKLAGRLQIVKFETFVENDNWFQIN